MRWKSWPYWVRGLAIGLVCGIIIDLYLLWNQEELFSAFPFCDTGGPCPFIFHPEWMYFSLTTSVVGLSVIGIFLGYFYGKVKNRKMMTSGFPPARE